MGRSPSSCRECPAALLRAVRVPRSWEYLPARCRLWGTNWGTSVILSGRHGVVRMLAAAEPVPLHGFRSLQLRLGGRHDIIDREPEFLLQGLERRRGAEGVH